MTSHYHPQGSLSCEVVVHGNGFLANVKTFAVSSSEPHPISPGTLKPGDTIRLEITPERGDSVTVRLGIVRWIDGNIVEVKIILMDADDKRTIDEVAWGSVRGEVKLFRWMRKLLWGDEVHHVCLSYTPRLCEERARLSEAA